MTQELFFPMVGCQLGAGGGEVMGGPCLDRAKQEPLDGSRARCCAVPCCAMVLCRAMVTRGSARHRDMLGDRSHWWGLAAASRSPLGQATPAGSSGAVWMLGALEGERCVASALVHSLPLKTNSFCLRGGKAGLLTSWPLFPLPC